MHRHRYAKSEDTDQRLRGKRETINNKAIEQLGTNLLNYVAMDVG